MSGPALYPGSFDPFTNGHLDIVDRALQLFDGLVVAVAANPEKRTPLFSPEERVAMIREALADRPTVEVTSARSRGIRVVVKGLRLPSDFEAELQQALMNRQLAPEIDTVFLISGLPQLFVSSSILKDVAGHGRDVGRFVPPVVARRLKERFS